MSGNGEFIGDIKLKSNIKFPRQFSKSRQNDISIAGPTYVGQVAKCCVISSLRFNMSSIGPWMYLQGIIFLVHAEAYRSLSTVRVKVKLPPKWAGEEIWTSLFRPMRVRGPPGPVDGTGPPKGTVGWGTEIEGLFLPLFFGLVIWNQRAGWRQGNGIPKRSTNSQQSKWQLNTAPNHRQVQKRPMNTPEKLIKPASSKIFSKYYQFNPKIN